MKRYCKEPKILTALERLEMFRARARGEKPPMPECGNPAVAKLEDTGEWVCAEHYDWFTPTPEQLSEIEEKVNNG